MLLYIYIAIYIYCQTIRVFVPNRNRRFGWPIISKPSQYF